jgi:site-specific DNA-cytosine methylase
MGVRGATMVRSIAVIIWALSAANPSLSAPVAKRYAKTIQVEAKRHHIDPFTLVAIFWHESGVRARAVSRDGEDYGLGQIRARFIGACAKDADPVKKPSAACRAVKSRLLEPTHNIKTTALHISKWRKLCRKKTGRSALFHRWLSGYGGVKGTCGQRKVKGKWRDLPRHPGVRSIIQCRKDLLRKRKCKRRTSASASRSRASKSSTRSRRGRSSTRSRRGSRSRRTR